ncbi:MAG: DNA-directed RNA polymerase subunit L [Candidatus Woesearchaeota archaeon]|jgi:DNA-directed RNA polymerase subunit L
MEYTIIEQKKDKIQIEIDANHTVCNLLVDELWQDKATVAAAYSVDHPLVAKPKILLHTDGKAPKALIIDAIKRLTKKNTDLAKLAAKAL